MSQWKPRLPRLLPPPPLQLSVKNGRPDNDCELVLLVRPDKRLHRRLTDIIFSGFEHFNKRKGSLQFLSVRLQTLITFSTPDLTSIILPSLITD